MKWCWFKGALAVVAGLVSSAVAKADFVVENGQTVVVTQTLTNDQTGLVKPGGRILSGGANGVVGVDGNTITNEGQIATTGLSASGIRVVNDNTINNTGTISTQSNLGFGITAADGNVIVNAGTISTAGSLAFAINAGDNNTVVNTGALSTTGVSTRAVAVRNNNTVTNAGTISTSGNSATGIFARDNNTISNTGRISTAGIAANGISVFDNNTIINAGAVSTAGGSANGVVLGDNNTLLNAGTISTSGIVAPGVLAFNDGNTIVNTGSITVSGTGSIGVSSTGNNTTVVNSGLIAATGGGASRAVSFTGTGNTLRLQPGSNLQGPIFFAAGNTLDITNGLSVDNTFTGSLPSIVANDAPFAVNDLQVAVVDPTALAMADDIVFDLTNSVSGSVFSRLRSQRLGGATGQAVASLDDGDPDDPLSFASSMGMDSGTEAWVEVFGLAREQRDTSPAVGADHYLGGVIAGIDTPVGADTRAGVFLGASYGELDVKFGSQDEDIGSAFIGVYGGYTSGPWAIDLVVSGGWSRYDLTRNVANNTVPGGVETASADYDGYFIAPELSVSRTVSVNGQEVIPSVQLGYAGTQLDGYTETGATNGLTVDDRFLHLLTGRFQVTVPVRIPAYADSIYFAPYAGVEGRTRLDNSDVDAVLLGQNISFDPGGEDSVGAALAGVELSALIDDGVSLFGRVEATAESNAGRTIAGQAGLQIAF